MASKGSSANKKGKEYERHVANVLAREFGIEMRRTPSQERWKITNQGDVNARDKTHAISRYHLELKNHSTIKIKEWWDKTKDDAELRKPALIFHVPKTTESLVCLSLEDFCSLIRELQGYIDEDATQE